MKRNNLSMVGRSSDKSLFSRPPRYSGVSHGKDITRLGTTFVRVREIPSISKTHQNITRVLGVGSNRNTTGDPSGRKENVRTPNVSTIGSVRPSTGRWSRVD